MASGPARDTLAKIHRPSNRYPFHIFGLGQGWRIFLRARTDIADNYIFPITAVTSERFFRLAPLAASRLFRPWMASQISMMAVQRSDFGVGYSGDGVLTSARALFKFSRRQHILLLVPPSTMWYCCQSLVSSV
jgi:hypothetical protein